MDLFYSMLRSLSYFILNTEPHIIQFVSKGFQISIVKLYSFEDYSLKPKPHALIASDHHFSYIL
jgi:hypothetical protein